MTVVQPDKVAPDCRINLPGAARDGVIRWLETDGGWGDGGPHNWLSYPFVSRVIDTGASTLITIAYLDHVELSGAFGRSLAAFLDRVRFTYPDARVEMSPDVVATLSALGWEGAGAANAPKTAPASAPVDHEQRLEEVQSLLRAYRRETGYAATLGWADAESLMRALSAGLDAGSDDPPDADLPSAGNAPATAPEPGAGGGQRPTVHRGYSEPERMRWVARLNDAKSWSEVTLRMDFSGKLLPHRTSVKKWRDEFAQDQAKWGAVLATDCQWPPPPDDRKAPP